jgi:hypothetical protein
MKATNPKETPRPGSLQRVVSRPAKNLNLAAFLQGCNAFEADAESGEITDCPYQTRLAKRAWWRGYHHAERTANNRINDQ